MYKQFLLLLLFIKVIQCAVYEESLTEIQEVKSIPCILKICEKYFRSRKAVIGSLVIINITPDSSTFQRNILSSLNENHHHDWAIMMKNAMKPHWNAAHVTEKAKNYFFLLKSSQDVISILKQLMRLPTWNPLAQVLILFVREMEPKHQIIEIKSVLFLLYQHSLLNVNVMYRKFNTSMIQVVTWYPYDGTNCADIVTNIKVIDECEYGKRSVEFDNVTTTSRTKLMFHETHYMADLGPKIPDNLHGCPLKISSGIWEPYVIFNKMDKSYSGIEVKMLRTITQQLNMQPVFFQLNQTRANIQIVEGKISFYEDLIEGRTDVMVGGLDENPITRKYVSSSIPYYQDDITWCVPKASLVPSWLNVFAIFSLSTWMTAVIVLHGTALLLHGFVKIEGKVTENIFWAILTSLATSLTVAVSYDPSRMFLRYYFITLLVYGMHFSAAYHSFLISVLTRPRYERQINSLSLAIHSSFSLTGGINALEYFDRRDKESQYVLNNFQPCHLIDDCLSQIRESNLLAVAVSREHSENNLIISPDEMFCFGRSNNIYSFSVVMLVKKDYHLRPRFDMIIRTILESGLLDMWKKQSRLLRLKRTVSKKDKTNDHAGAHGGGQIVLSVDHILGAFYLSFIGYSAAILTFIAEIIVFWLSKKFNFSTKKIC